MSRNRVPVVLPEEWQHGPLVELIGAVSEAVRDLAEDMSLEAAGQRKAFARVLRMCIEIRKRQGE